MMIPTPRGGAARPRGPLPLALCGGLLLAGACSSGGTGTTAMGLAGTPLLADSNRDGVVDEKDAAGRATWSAAAGALFLANLDDDDGKGAADASDEIVNGAEDDKDLARLRLSAWPGAPAGATVTLTIDEALAADKVHLFQHGPAGWTLLTLPATLAVADVQAGVELGVEAVDLVQEIAAGSWDGLATVHAVFSDGKATIADDRVALRVAPFVMINNASVVGQLWHAAYLDSGGTAFVRDLTTMTDEASAELIGADPPDLRGDQWAEDWWQVAVTFMPAAGGAHGMRLAQRSAQPDRDAGGWAEMQLGPDVGYIWPHSPRPQGQADPKAYSLDSFGNHDTVPPHSKGSDSYPLGRIIVGGTDEAHIDPVVRAFYDAQRVQPVVQIDTGWLFVGHIDEIFSYVPANTARGWKLLVSSPKLARAMLQKLSADGHGATPLFAGKTLYTIQGKAYSAATTVDKLLGDPEVMAANEVAQMKIDADLAVLSAELGLSKDEVVEMPFLWERLQVEETGNVNGYVFVAHMPGTVNLRVVNAHLGIPRPHGPVVGGKDAFEQDLVDRLSSPVSGLGADGQGLPITFIEDWDDYHAADGEVHCGTTTAATTMPATRWWEAGR